MEFTVFLREMAIASVVSIFATVWLGNITAWLAGVMMLFMSLIMGFLNRFGLVYATIPVKHMDNDEQGSAILFVMYMLAVFFFAGAVAHASYQRMFSRSLEHMGALIRMADMLANRITVMLAEAIVLRKASLLVGASMSAGDLLGYSYLAGCIVHWCVEDFSNGIASTEKEIEDDDWDGGDDL